MCGNDNRDNLQDVHQTQLVHEGDGLYFRLTANGALVTSAVNELQMRSTLSDKK